MTQNLTDKQRPLSWLPLSPLSLLVLIGIGARIFLLNWYRGEYTDGIIQLQLFDNENTFFPPLYPLLVNWLLPIVRDQVLAGRLVSLLASSLTLIPIYHLTRRLFGARAAWWAGLLYLTAAVPNRWALRVMTDSLFTFFFTVGILAFIRSMEAPTAESIANLPKKMSLELNQALIRVRQRRWLYLLIGITGFATLTRYQGLALIPLVFISAWRNRRGYSRWEMVETLLSLLPWAAMGYWLAIRGFGHIEQFTGRVHGTLGQTLLAYWNMAETFILYFPYAMTIPVFALFIAGLFSGRWAPGAKYARWTLAGLFLVWLVVHAAFQSFQYRYFLPLIPLMIVFAGGGMATCFDYLQRRRWKGSLILGSVIVAISLTFSACVLYFQRDAFADFTAVGELIAGGNLKGGRILAAEIYNKGNYNLKLSYWACQEIPFCEPMMDFPFQDGDYLVLSTYYNDLGRVAQILQSRHIQFKSVHKTDVYTLRPLLPDIMSNPPHTTSQPLCMAYRFHQQAYFSTIIRIHIPGQRP